MVTCYICRRDVCRTFNKFYYLGMINLKYIYIYIYIHFVRRRINLKYIYIYTLCKETDLY
jgi:hypothetical protein